jgi:hypothetical protein
MFVDSIGLGSSFTSPITNGTSDHDAQFLIINIYRMFYYIYVVTDNFVSVSKYSVI